MWTWTSANGGYWRFEMVPDSAEYPAGGPVNATFDDVAENELLLGHEDLGAEMQEFFGSDRIDLRIELHDEDGKTRLVLQQGPYKEEISSDAREGWTSSFTKLDATLAA